MFFVNGCRETGDIQGCCFGPKYYHAEICGEYLLREYVESRSVDYSNIGSIFIAIIILHSCFESDSFLKSKTLHEADRMRAIEEITSGFRVIYDVQYNRHDKNNTINGRGNTLKPYFSVYATAEMVNVIEYLQELGAFDSWKDGQSLANPYISAEESRKRLHNLLNAFKFDERESYFVMLLVTVLEAGGLLQDWHRADSNTHAMSAYDNACAIQKYFPNLHKYRCKINGGKINAIWHYLQIDGAADTQIHSRNCHTNDTVHYADGTFNVRQTPLLKLQQLVENETKSIADDADDLADIMNLSQPTEMKKHVPDFWHVVSKLRELKDGKSTGVEDIPTDGFFRLRRLVSAF